MTRKSGVAASGAALTATGARPIAAGQTMASCQARGASCVTNGNNNNADIVFGAALRCCWPQKSAAQQKQAQKPRVLHARRRAREK